MSVKIKSEYNLRDEVFIYDTKDNTISLNVITSITLHMGCRKGLFLPKEADEDFITYEFALKQDSYYVNSYNNSIFIAKDYDTLLKQVKEYYNNRIDQDIARGTEIIRNNKEVLKQVYGLTL